MVEKDVINFWNYRYGSVENLNRHSCQNSSISKCFIENITDKLNNIFNNSKNIIEIGCGTGELSNLLKEKYINLQYILATDVVENSINYCKTLYTNIDFKVFNILNDQVDRIYDVSICSNVIEHFKNPYSIIDKLINISKYVLILVPYNEDVSSFEQYYVQDGGEPHVFSFNEDTFKNYNILESFKFYSPEWFGPNSDKQFAVLLKGDK